MLPVKYIQQYDSFYDTEDESVTEYMERQSYMRELNRRYSNLASKLAFHEMGFASGPAIVRRNLHIHRIANPIGYTNNDAIGSISTGSTVTELLQQRMCMQLELSEHKEIISTHKGPVSTLSIDYTEQRYLLTAGNDCVMCLYDLETDVGIGESTSVVAKSKDAEPQPAQKKRRLMDNTQAIREQQIIRKVKRSQFSPIARIQRPQSHEFAISCVEWFPFDTGMFVSGSFDRHVAVWDTNELVRVSSFKLPDKVYGLSMSKCASNNQSLIAVASKHQVARLIDLVSGTMTHSLQGHRDSVMAIQFSPTNEHLLATASSDKTVRLWDTRKAGWIMCLDMLNTPNNPHGEGEEGKRFSTKKYHAAATVPHAHDGMVNALCFTPDGKHLLTSGKDQKARLWDVESGQNLLVSYAGIKNSAQTSFKFAISSNGQVLYHPNEGLIGCYDIFSGRPLGELAGHYSYVNALAFFEREQELLSASSDRQIFVWSPKRTNDSYRVDPDEDGGMKDEDQWSDTET